MSDPIGDARRDPGAMAHRAEALQRYAVLDTDPEHALDDLTKLAATICGTPIALITFLEADRQWFKSRVGLSIDETSLESSFCIHAIEQPELFIVPDAAQDARFAQNPFVTGAPGIRFYAGAPLLTPAGVAIGTLCVIDRIPRALTPEQEEALRVLGRQVMTHLELRRHIRELMESEDVFAKAFRLSPDGVTIVRVSDRTIIKANDAICQLLGLDENEVIGRPSVKFSRWVDEKEREIFLRTLEEKGECLNFEMNLLGADQAPMRLNSSSRLLTLNAEPCILSVMRDVTAERRAQAALAASELRYRRLFESAKDGILILDAETGMVVDANPFMVSMLGFSHGEFLGKAVWELGFFKDLLANEDKFAELREKEYVRYESLPLETSDGRKIEVEFVSNVYLVDGGKVIQCNVRDITERRRTETHLKLLETCVARLNDMVVITEAELLAEPGPRIVFVNEAFMRQTGYTEAEVLGHSPRFMQGPKTNRAELDRIHAALNQREAVRAELVNYKKNGEEMWVEIEIVPVSDAGGRLTHFVAIERNVTKRKHAEARYHRLIDSNAQGIMFWKTNGEVTGANDAFLELVGYTRAEMETGEMNWLAMTPPEFAELDRRALEEIAARGIFTPFEKEYIRKDGSRVPLLIGAAAFEDSPTEGVSFAVDLTERKNLERQFLRAQRMESIGTLAGGIAHDLNNVLTPILLSLEVLRMKCTDRDSLELLAILGTSAQRGADLVRQVLSFARGVEGRRMEVQVRHLIMEIETIANETFPKRIRLLSLVPHNLWTVIGDPTQLHQVLMNLCVNARDAMPAGGTLTISAENLTLDAQYAGMSVSPEAKPGPYILLQVRDTGTGMSMAVIDKIFEPFFTTKELGNGTGLGLSTTLGIVRSHSGFIRVYSELGKGTTFKIYLPAQIESSAEAIAEATTELPRGHDELILVVDDEIAVCQITRQTLELFGYRVILAADGAEAVAIFAMRHAEIAVVLTDMMMPVMDGPATIRVLRKLDPTVRVIAASGLSDGDSTAEAASLGVRHFLAKPYTAEALLKALREVLSLR